MPLIVTPGHLYRRGDFYFQLASMTHAGLPIIQALETLKNSFTRAGNRAPIDNAIRLLNGGATLEESFRAQGKWLPQFDLALIGAGEQSGRLDFVFRELGRYYQEQAILWRRVLGRLAYPIFIVHFAILIFPTSLLTGMLTAGGIERWVNNKVVTLLTLYTVTLLGFICANGPFGRRWKQMLSSLANMVPVLGKARKNLALARFSGALGALMGAGVSVTDSWRLAGEASGSSALQKAAGWAVPRIQAGVTPSEAVNQLPVFPDMFRSLYRSGERSGQLDSTLQRLNHYYEEQASRKFESFGEWLPRLVFLVVAVAIGFEVITFWTGYYGQMFDRI